VPSTYGMKKAQDVDDSTLFGLTVKESFLWVARSWLSVSPCELHHQMRHTYVRTDHCDNNRSALCRLFRVVRRALEAGHE
jgi:hypothetical protein